MVEGARLESVCTVIPYRGFESLSLRHSYYPPEGDNMNGKDWCEPEQRVRLIRRDSGLEQNVQHSGPKGERQGWRELSLTQQNTHPPKGNNMNGKDWCEPEQRVRLICMDCRLEQNAKYEHSGPEGERQGWRELSLTQQTPIP